MVSTHGEGRGRRKGRERRGGRGVQGRGKAREKEDFLNFQLSQTQRGARHPGCTARSINRTTATTTARSTARKSG